MRVRRATKKRMQKKESTVTEGRAGITLDLGERPANNRPGADPACSYLFY